ncbi:MAG: TonB-dependent receptor [Pseudomonadota bacterium]
MPGRGKRFLVNPDRRTIPLLILLLLAAAGPGPARADDGKDDPEPGEVEEVKEEEHGGDEADEEVLRILDEEAGEKESGGADGEDDSEGLEGSALETQPGKHSGKTDKPGAKKIGGKDRIDWDESFEKEFMGEEYEVITPSKKYEDLFYTIPAAVLIRRVELFESNARDFDWAARNAPGIHWVHLQDSAPSPVIRGLYGNRLAILFDGIRLPTAASPAGLDYLSGLVDMQSLKSMELVPGPSAVLYGSSAMGGTINYIPQSPTISPYISKAMNAKGLLRYSTLDSSIDFHADTSLLTSDSGLHVGLSMADHGNLSSGIDGESGILDTEREKQPFTGYEKIGLAISGSRLFHPSHEIKLGYYLTYLKKADRKLPGSSDYLRWPSHQKHLVYIRYTGKDIASLEQLTFTGGINYQKEKHDRHLMGLIEGPRTDKDRIQAGSIFGLFDLRAPLGSWGSILYGLDYYFDRINTTSTVRESISSETTYTHPEERGMYDDGATLSDLATYALLELYNLRPALITIGGRAIWNYIDTAAEENPNLFGGGAQIEIRIPIGGRLKSTKVVTLSDILAVNIIGSYIARPPSLDELSAMRTVSEGILFGNPALDNEHMAGAQAGLKWDAGIIVGSLYYGYTHLASMIQSVPISSGPSIFPKDHTELCGSGYRCWTYVNGGKADLHSVELTSQVNISNYLIIGLVFNYTHGSRETPSVDNEPMSYIPPLGGAVWIKGMVERYGLWGELRLQLVWKQENLSSRDLSDPAMCSDPADCDGTGAFLLLDLRGGVRITRRLFLSLAITNLTDSEYRTHGSILYGPGIGATIAVEARL